MILHGNSLERLKEFPDNYFDSIVTDPPYGLSFMGKKWDYDVPTTELWKEALRVLKPGGHLLSFFGTRTYHRGVVRIEDAGFEIRDQIMWIYGSGFPKSHNIKEGDFKGFGTALKPANEPIVVARKPLEKSLTVAENVQKWGTGAINIDGSRIATDENVTCTRSVDRVSAAGYTEVNREKNYSMPIQGRWPANIIFDEEAAAMLDEQVSKTMKMHGAGNKSTGKGKDISDKSMFGVGQSEPTVTYDNSGEDSSKASRFFYVAKASKRERGQENVHPTVKPIKLMEYLITLVTPPNGIVLDPFCGSGSTGVAAKKLGFGFVGIELSEEYAEIAKKRCEVVA